MDAPKPPDALQLAQFSLDRAAIGILRIAVDGTILSANEFICQKLGYTREELCAMRVFDINPTLTPEIWAGHIKSFVGLSVPRSFETTHRRKSGSTLPVEVTVNYLQFDGQEFFVACARDLTDEKLAEAERAKLRAQLTQSQRLESIGRLAGGVAHDFNNMLSVILGSAELVLSELEPGSPLRADVEQILLAAERSGDLTRQLLAFARKQTIVPRALDLNEVITGMLKMLRRLIGEDIDVTVKPEPALWPVHMDPAQVDQVLVNLLVNARDAISGGGAVLLETKNVTVDDAARAPHRGLPPGEWVRLSVSDSGAGMDADTLEHLFEPFFTTKERGKGTGLGLATVFGVVSQNEGHIFVDSAPGRGATFAIYLPRARVVQPAAFADRAMHLLAGGTETVLLVEDDPMVLRLTRAQLETLGYTVLAAASPAEALALLDAHGANVALLLTDVVMPGMSGRELAQEVKRRLPRVAVVLMSGYAADSGHRLEPGTVFLQKPITRGALAEKLRHALDAAPRDNAAPRG